MQNESAAEVAPNAQAPPRASWRYAIVVSTRLRAEGRRVDARLGRGAGSTRVRHRSGRQGSADTTLSRTGTLLALCRTHPASIWLICAVVMHIATQRGTSTKSATAKYRYIAAWTARFMALKKTDGPVRETNWCQDQTSTDAWCQTWSSWSGLRLRKGKRASQPPQTRGRVKRRQRRKRKAGVAPWRSPGRTRGRGRLCPAARRALTQRTARARDQRRRFPARARGARTGSVAARPSRSRAAASGGDG